MYVALPCYVEHMAKGTTRLRASCATLALVALLLSACAPLSQPPRDSSAQVVFMTSRSAAQVPGGTEASSWDLTVMDLDGAHRARLASGGEQAFLPHFSPDGRKLLYTRFTVGGYGIPKSQSRITTYDIVTTTTHDLTTGDAESYPVWSPDGTRIAFLRDAGGVGGGALWVMNADGSAPHEVARPTGGALDKLFGDIAWSSQDWILLVVGQVGIDEQCFKTRLDKIRPDGSARTQVTDGGPSCTPPGMEQSGDADPGFSADGATIYTSRGFPYSPPGLPGAAVRKLYAIASDAWYPGKTERDLSLPGEPDCVEGVPKGSPDGLRILLFRVCGAGKPGGIVVTDVNGSYRTYVTAGFGPDWNPAWSGR